MDTLSQLAKQLKTLLINTSTNYITNRFAGSNEKLGELSLLLLLMNFLFLVYFIVVFGLDHIAQLYGLIYSFVAQQKKYSNVKIFCAYLPRKTFLGFKCMTPQYMPLLFYIETVKKVDLCYGFIVIYVFNR